MKIKRSILSSEKSKVYIQASAVIDSRKGTNSHFILLGKKPHSAIHEHPRTDDLAEDFAWPQ